jgi:CheY-like chemotaxis protein
VLNPGVIRGGSLENRTILVVDDNEGVRMVYWDYLTRAGFSVTEASNGMEALAILREGLVPSLIILDMEMPKMNGLQFLAYRRKDPRLASIPVLLSSGMAWVDEIADALGLEFLYKPCSHEEFIKKISLNSSRSSDNLG